MIGAKRLAAYPESTKPTARSGVFGVQPILSPGVVGAAPRSTRAAAGWPGVGRGGAGPDGAGQDEHVLETAGRAVAV